MITMTSHVSPANANNHLSSEIMFRRDFDGADQQERQYQNNHHVARQDNFSNEEELDVWH